MTRRGLRGLRGFTTAIAIAFLVAFLVGPAFVAEQVYGTPQPSNDQIKVARLFIIVPVIVPFLLFLGWGYWRQRGAERDWAARTQGQRIEDSSKRSSVE